MSPIADGTVGVKQALSIEQERELGQLATEGVTYVELARRFSCHYNTARNICRRLGVRKGDGRRRVVDESDWLRLLALYDEGKSLEEAARVCEFSRKLAMRLLVESGREYETRSAGANNPAWRGGRISDGRGYVMVWIDLTDPMFCMATVPRRQYVFEHRLVMARHLGRPLTRQETVHHINGIRDDNRLENLQLRSSAHGPGAAFRCLDCGSVNVLAEALEDGESDR